MLVKSKPIGSHVIIFHLHCFPGGKCRKKQLKATAIPHIFKLEKDADRSSQSSRHLRYICRQAKQPSDYVPNCIDIGLHEEVVSSSSSTEHEGICCMFFF